MPQKQETLHPDYRNCIANLPNSVMRYFGVQPAGETLPLLDCYLDGDYKNVVVILLDGMGVNILERNLDENGFFRSHLAGIYSSVFPPTTVAATTSALSGLQPCAHGWLGWDCYYPQIDQNVTVFSNRIQYTDTAAADYHVAGRYTAYTSLLDRFKQAGKQAYAVTPFVPPHPHSFRKVCKRIKTLCRRPGKKYIYAYWNEPDHMMHEKGCYGDSSVQTLRALETQAQALCKKLKDTIVIVTADHGHIDTENVCLTDYPSLTDCMVRMASIEPRALNLFIKDGMHAQFAETFNRLFGDDYLLLTKEEVLEKQLFGTEQVHPCFQSMLGDYLAVAVGCKTLFNTKEELAFRGVHAGLTVDEMRIPLIVYR